MTCGTRTAATRPAGTPPVATTTSDLRTAGSRTGGTSRARSVASLALALPLVLSLAACGDRNDGTLVPGDGAAAEQSADGAVVDAGHNAADVEFAQGMIEHHEGAVEMAELAIVTTESPEIRTLAEAILAAQAPEIEQMSGWLGAWGEDVDAHAGMDHGGTHAGGTDMGADMERLGGLSGAEFDRAFLEAMIEHHRGAVVMAQTELDEGSHPEALALAETIVADQTAEIAQMDAMLADL